MWKRRLLSRTYFYYPIHCSCCGCKDKNGQKQHFVIVSHCNECNPNIPTEIHPMMIDNDGNEYKVTITDIMPEEISGEYSKK